MKLIVAVNKKGYIGLNDELPWRSKEDLKHFKENTLGCKLLVGRKTFEKMPALKGRQFLVVGTGYLTLEEALSMNPDWIIGGASIYKQTSHLCSEHHISIINDDTEGDTKLDPLTAGEGTKTFLYHFDIN